jgi:histidinol-phosphate/aromatic aminotransferase/cobyric acid decarboxylase-like protein
MKTFKAITTVYSYYLPEVRELITDLTREYPHDVFLRSISPGLEDFHVSIIDKLIAAHRRDVPHLSQFSYRYPTAGSEEGIREYLTLLQSQGVEQICVWKGDYEGYRETAKTRNIAAVEVDYDSDPAAIPPGHWFLSNPSARDGMIVPREKVWAIAEAGHRVFYDLSYLGATGPSAFDLSHPNIAATVVSFSKPYGLFYYRVGFTLAREPIPALYANKWFKNVYALLIADRILDEIDLTELARKYKIIQADIVGRINQTLELGLLTSDAFLLARLPATAASRLNTECQAMIAKFQRGNGYRFCLTPYFEAYEKCQ